MGEPPPPPPPFRLSEQATNKHVNGSLGERASPPLILPSSLPIFSRFLAFPSSYIIRLAINTVFNESPTSSTLGGIRVASTMTKLLPWQWRRRCWFPLPQTRLYHLVGLRSWGCYHCHHQQWLELYIRRIYKVNLIEKIIASKLFIMVRSPRGSIAVWVRNIQSLLSSESIVASGSCSSQLMANAKLSL